MKRERLALVSIFAFLAYLVVAFGFYFCCLDHMILGMYGGHSYPLVGNLIHGSDHAPLSYYILRAHLLFSRLILLSMVAGVILTAAFAYDHMYRIFARFFTTPKSALNLSIFRVIVFVAVLLDMHPSEAIWFSTLPRALQIAPFGVGWLLPHLPISKSLMTMAVILLFAACVMGIVGLFTRTSAAIAFVVSLYVLGMSQFYGKVSHDQHLLWFLAILAASPCGDTFSIDAIRTAIKCSRKDKIPFDKPSIVYSLPLSFASLLLGLIYFFPGFRKLWTSGFDWALSDNLKYQMYAKWVELGGWTPVFRLDLHPGLYRTAALISVSFEVSFIFLILLPRLRGMAAMGGLIFHSGSWIFMRIFFYDLLLCYVALFDMDSLLKGIGQRLYPGGLTAYYDQSCSSCRQMIAVFSVVDVLHCLTFVPLQKAPEGGSDLLPCDQDLPDLGIRSVSGHRSWTGFPAYRAMAIRVPVLWPIVPFLYVPSAEKVFASLYRLIAGTNSSLLCYGDNYQDDNVSPLSSRAWRAWLPTVMVGVFLLVANAYCGEHRILSGWPFACYPTFESIQDDELDFMEMRVVGASGQEMPFSPNDIEEKLTPQRFRGLQNSLLQMRVRNQADFAKHLKALWHLYLQEDPHLAQVTTVRFYDVIRKINPGRSRAE